ncbi:MAG TPA: RodZ domain-containing protein [Gaiellaceae bacterium]|nr:RodZ domain-containing protein [Gaiellaceae bacterium]
MFEIGNSLREARLRQGLELPRIETETKIRGKYLRALEEERFDVLPGDTYVKGFLRTYAEYLGLDGQLYLDEYNSRFTTAEEPLAPQSSASSRPTRRRMESNFVVVALAGIVAVTVLVVVGLAGLGEGGEPPADPLIGTTPDTTSVSETTETTAAAPRTPKVRKARLVLAAAHGPSWMEVRAGSVNGETLYEGTLELGQTQRFTAKRLWINLGSPANLRVRLNGREARDFPTTSAVVLVTAKRVRTLSTT